MTAIAERNRKIKTVLSNAFGRGKVSVRGERGTAYGWVRVEIAYAPKDRDERETLTKKVWELFAAANIEIETYGYDDPGSDYGFGKTIIINFEQCRDVFNEGEAVTTCNGHAGVIHICDYSAGGDWYVIDMANGSRQRFYKKDLTRTMVEAA